MENFLPMPPGAATSYEKLRKVSVNDRIEKKNGLSYLSWAFAVDQLLQLDPDATWTYPDFKSYGETLMVFCAVTAFGRTRTAQLPVMDHRNKAIVNPNAFDVNTAMQRCLVKAIALHGLALYIYAGEDLPDNHEVKGDLGATITLDEARTMATRMRGILEADVEEGVKGMHVADLHDAIRDKHDLYTAAAEQMSTKERSAWKAYLKMARDALKGEPLAPNGRA